MQSTITTNDFEYAQQHICEQAVTVRCLECGEFLLFKLASRANELDILAQSHQCEVPLIRLE